MASAIIHYAVSCLLLIDIEITQKNRFLLGATLGPDASSHFDGTYDLKLPIRISDGNPYKYRKI